MRAKLPRFLVTAGIILLLVGLIGSVTMLVVQNHCQHTQTPGPYSDMVSACQSYGMGADWGYLVLALGAIAIVAGGISSTAAVQRPRPNQPAS